MKVATLNEKTLKLFSDLKRQLDEQKKDRQSTLERNSSHALSAEEGKKFAQELAKINDSITDNEARLDDLNYYCGLGCKDDADSLHKHGFDDWMRITKMHKYFTDNDRPKYEAFVEGWLLYFEKYSSTQISENRTLFFDWGKTRPGEYELIIYLKPLHNRNYFDYKYAEANHAGSFNEYVSSGGNSDAARSPLPQPPSTTDPHQPPPPPPPPRGDN